MSSTGTNKNFKFTLNDILQNNENIRFEITKRQKEIESLSKQIIAPCEHCPYDGVYRCETCKDNNYEGFNIKDYPRKN